MDCLKHLLILNFDEQYLGYFIILQTAFWANIWNEKNLVIKRITDALPNIQEIGSDDILFTYIL